MIAKLGLKDENICYDGVDKLYEKKYGMIKKHFINLKRLDFKDFANQLGTNNKVKSKTYKRKPTYSNNEDGNTRTKTAKTGTRKRR